MTTTSTTTDIDVDDNDNIFKGNSKFKESHGKSNAVYPVLAISPSHVTLARIFPMTTISIASR